MREMLDRLPADIRKHCKIIELKSGQTYIQKGGIVRTVDILCSGQMQVLNEFENGNVYCFAAIQPIAYIGSLEVLADAEVYSSTTEALTPCTLISMPKEIFIEWLNSDHALAMEIGRFIARCLYEQSWKTGEAAVYPALYVAAAFFIKVFEASSDDNVMISISRQQLANELGYSIRTVNRNIKLLKEEGCLTVKRQCISINGRQYDKLLKLLKEIKESL
ncbi:MAG: Crp/Fnr family transcriptional regulator [Bacillota bacterium]